MSTITEIREAIQKLPPKEAWQLAQDLRSYLDKHARGETRSMDEIIGNN